MPRTVTLCSFALIALLAACAGPGASPSPTLPPSPTPVPTPTPSPTFGPNDISHPSGATDVVLRMEQGGGFVPMGWLVTQAPTFTLYGDGTVIFKQIDARMSELVGGQAELPWLVGHIDETAIQALLQFALSTGRLAGARDHYDNPMIADAYSTIFQVNAGGIEKTVSVYALVEAPEPGPDAADRQGFSQLAAVLNDFSSQTGVDLGEVTEYDAELYRLTLVPGFGEPPGPSIDWPWDDLTLADWPEGEEPGNQVNVLDKAHVELLMAVPNGGHHGVWVTAPDGSVISFGVRPLLPDEIAALNAG